MLNLGRLGFLKRRNKAGKSRLSVKVPSETRYIKKVSEKILSSLSAYRLSEAKIFDIRLCVEEAVRNSVVHGNHANKRLAVIASWWVDADRVHIEVEDEGAGFDHRKVADPTSGEHIMKNSGRGVYLIKKLMDKVVYNDKGNIVTMTTAIKQGQ